MEDVAVIFDLCTGASMSSAGNNRRPMLATGGKTPVRDGWELLAWAMLELAIEDTAILCRYGLIDSEGELLAWPKVRKRDVRKPDTYQWEPMRIANMNDGLDHGRLRDFWLEPDQAQVWCDLCGCRLPAKDIWKSILENHAK
jgi:hypothetical protein